jgi:F0F1-type ATP synthase assembly protein I
VGKSQTPSRYPRDRKPMPKRTPAQTARLWQLSLCGAVPGAVVVYLTDSFVKGAAVCLAVVIVLGFILRQYEKSKQK